MLMGYAFGFMNVFLVAISTICLNRFGQGIALPILLLYTSLTSILIFNLINIKQFKRSHTLILSARRNWLHMSVCLVFVWVFSYYATIHGSPEFFIATAFLTAAFFTGCVEKKPLKAAACLSSLGLVYAYSDNHSLKTLAAGMIAGAAMYAYYRSSYQFSQKTHMSAIAILSIRFYLVPVFAILFIIATGDLPQLRISFSEMTVILGFALINMILPAFLSQTSLQAIGVSQFTFLNTLIPALTLALDATFKHVLHVEMLVACLCATLALNIDQLAKVVGVLRQRRYKNAKEPFVHL